jgi:hypothetical protein
MLGNDVVDLLDPESRPESFRPRFDERVFSPAEREAIAEDPDPLARRWAHWAAKEAAYKLARQLDSTFIFSPGRLVANYSPPEKRVGPRLERRGRLVLEGCGPGSGGHRRPISLRSFETSERIHVVAIPESTDWEVVDHAVEAVDAFIPANAAAIVSNTANTAVIVDDAAQPGASGRLTDSSVAVRAMALGEIGRRLGVSLDRLSIGRRERIPVIMLDGAETSLSLSLSHHGKWIGYAMALRMDSVPRPIPSAGRQHASSSSSPIPSPTTSPIPSAPQPSPMTNRAPIA